MPITRREDQPLGTFREQQARMDANCRAVREAQNRANAQAAQSARTADDRAREVLGRLRRRKIEIDPEGRLPQPAAPKLAPRGG